MAPTACVAAFACSAIVVSRVVFRVPLKYLNWVFARCLYGSARCFGFPKVHLCGEYSLLEGPSPKIYVSNHQSNWDVVTLGSLFPKNTFVLGKKELAWVPFFGAYFFHAGNVLVNRKNHRAARQALSAIIVRVLNKSRSIFVFPEGTRNSCCQEKLLEFKRGAFDLSLKSRVPVVPIVVSPLSNCKNKIIARILPLVDPAHFQSADEMKQRVQQMMEEELSRSYTSSI
jgi:1-acyl-sn-glycerol-3-phosphate acyltransferase